MTDNPEKEAVALSVEQMAEAYPKTRRLLVLASVENKILMDFAKNCADLPTNGFSNRSYLYIITYAREVVNAISKQNLAEKVKMERQITNDE
ncbi:MAG: hypothetical protein LBH41_00650 [Rickettsiales bacterium]|jgi:hypothetical protein|nr:hypothetical protein [Rickettsiales bacterium]